MVRFSSLVSSILLALQLFGLHCTCGENDPKIAFMFLSRGHIPLEDVWREFFGWNADSNHYSIYVHPQQGFKFHKTSFFYGKEIAESHAVLWGGMGQVRAIKSLVREALRDPLNEWFCLMSEACIPLRPFSMWREAFQLQKKSIINACLMDPAEAEVMARWRPGLDEVGMTKSQWRKSSTWFALNRKHSLIFVNETKLEKGWEQVPCCDEHYLPSILAYNNMDNETTCTDGFVHVHWDSLSDSHPHTYRTDEIDEKLVSELQRPVSSHVGFNQQCSGNEIVCHFTARKFSGHSRFTLIEKVHLLLDDTIGGVLFSNDRWNQINTKLRIIEDKYYVIEDGFFRGIPDMPTLVLMHLNTSYAMKPSAEESKAMTIGSNYPSRKDGQILKARKSNELFLVQAGKRRPIPDMDTFEHLGFSMKEVSMISETDMMQIPRGAILPIS